MTHDAHPSTSEQGYLTPTVLAKLRELVEQSCAANGHWPSLRAMRAAGFLPEDAELMRELRPTVVRDLLERLRAMEEAMKPDVHGTYIRQTT